MLYVKVVHLLFIISWMAGIFYLPRICVHYVEGQRAGEDVRRLAIMARKLHGFATLMGVLALASGTWLLSFGFSGGWVYAKLGFVLLLAAYHFSLHLLVRRLHAGEALPSAVALRWYNELPLLLLLAILYFVVLKPF